MSEALTNQGICTLPHPWRAFFEYHIKEAIVVTFFFLPAFLSVFVITMIWEISTQIIPTYGCTCKWPWLRLWKHIFTEETLPDIFWILRVFDVCLFVSLFMLSFFFPQILTIGLEIFVVILIFPVFFFAFLGIMGT